MTDITKCVGWNCKKKDKCYRYTCPTGIQQSYCNFETLSKGKCEYFIDNKNYAKR